MDKFISVIVFALAGCGHPPPPRNIELAEDFGVELSISDAAEESPIDAAIDALYWPEQHRPDEGPPPQPLCAPFGHQEGCDTPLEGLCSDGVRTCWSDAWSECVQTHSPRPERCDGEDNDCDGVVDEGQDGPLHVSCYTGPVRTAKVGQCSTGVAECVGGSYGECVGQIEPTEEICDHGDNDCDGVIDEGVLNVCGECGDPPEELCNFVDDDCDGVIDEGAGDCMCDNPRYVPQEESCNGIDDDCDGRVDEGPDGGPMTAVCSTRDEGIVVFLNREDVPRFNGGRCRPGVSICEQRIVNGVDSYGYFECQHEIQPSSERCNGEDDDCDGVIDEGYEPGTVAVMLAIDVSGSMQPDELMEAFTSTQRAVMRLHNAGAVSLRYILVVLGSSGANGGDPYVLRPTDQCVEGVQDPPGVPRVDLFNSTMDLRDRLERGRIDRVGNTENSFDALGAFFVEDLLDLDGDGALDTTTWETDDPASPDIDIDLSEYTHRVAVVLGDEEGQGVIWTDESVSRAMSASGGTAYIIGPDPQSPAGMMIANSYSETLGAGAVYWPIRSPGGDNQIADGIEALAEELECLSRE